MAKISFHFRGKKEDGKLSVRLIHTKEIDYRVSTPIISKRSYWFNKKGKHIKFEALPYFAEIKNHRHDLYKFAELILNAFHEDYNSGFPITAHWLKNKAQEVTPMINKKKYLSQLNEQRIEREEQERRQQFQKEEINLLENAIRAMISKYESNKGEQKKYNSTLSKLQAYQDYKGVKFKLRDFNQMFVDDFTNWQHILDGCKITYTATVLKRIKASVNYIYDNDELDIADVSKNRNSVRLPKAKKGDKIVVHLDYDELDLIDEKEIEGTELKDAKKAILIGCETALRYSDFNKLNSKNLLTRSDGRQFWEFRTNKTDKMVRITKSIRIIDLLERYGLPRTDYPEDEIQLNKDIKQVCRIAGIKNKILGDVNKAVKINGKKVRRDVRDLYPKNKLITTRTFRRSFATNYYGEIDIDVILGTTGHSNEKMLREYLNLQDERKVDKAIHQMDEYHENRKKKAEMKVVKRLIK